MFEFFLTFFTRIDSIFWGCIAFVLIMVLGCYFTVRTRFFQVRALPCIGKTFWHFLHKPSQTSEGIHPLRALFASVGGMIGIGNVVGIVTAVQFGGPGALIWVWVAALFGSVIKYCEIYLGLKYRVANGRGGYDGGPMFFLKHAFKNRWVPIFVSILLCIYGVEIYQFTVLTDSIVQNWDFNRYAVIFGLLILILYAGHGGVKRIGKICGWTMPFFMAAYILLSLWILLQGIADLPGVLLMVFKSAFTGHAAIGGFAGSTMILALQHGISRAAYSADIGIGYDSIIHSESSTVYPERQARLAVLGVCMDNFICTLSILVVLITGVWKAEIPIDASLLVQTALSQYFPFMPVFMPFFIFVLGYTTVIAYFCVGLKCARFLSPKHGVKIYFFYAAFSLFAFSFLSQTQALLMMSLSGALLLITNLMGIFCLRKEVVFDLAFDETEKPTAVPALGTLK